MVHSFDELLALGAAKPAEPVPPKPDDLCTIMYTSGEGGWGEGEGRRGTGGRRKGGRGSKGWGPRV